MVLGFVNSLAILIFLSQISLMINAPLIMYAMVAGTLAIVYILPKFTKAIPSTLVAIVIMTALAMGMHLNVLSVGDLGTNTSALPVFHLPMVPL